ncbi:ABC transporter permease [Georgenia faecalis]|uniref:ABC transporter permease n=1 Tax=Georgenia faecalis TaxID=2483799 RepID=UPI001F4A05A8|nr:ABC transporter permease [Georgenia faecalis]
MRQLWTMTVSDLRQRLRDRSVLLYGLVVPLALMFVFDLTLGDQEVELEPLTVAVAAPEGDVLADAVVTVLGDLDDLDVTVEEVSPDAASARVADGEAGLAVIVPAGFTDAVTAGEGPVVEVVEGDGTGLEGDVVLSVLDAVLDQLAAGALTAAAGAEAGLPTEVVASLGQAALAAAPVVTLEEGEAANEQLSASGALVAGQAGLFLLFTVGFGVLGLVAERETGTMPRLRSMPMRPGRIVAAKALVSYLLGVGATAVLLTAGSVLFDVSFGSPVAVAALVLAAVAAATSLMFVIARVARTAEQANAVQSIFALVLGLTGGAFFPLSATGLAGQLLDVNPVAALTRGLGITSGGGGLADLGVPVLTMLGFAVVCVVLARLVPDRGEAR